MHVAVFGRSEIENGIISPTSYVVVSISDPRRRLPRIPRSAGFRGAVRLQFHDAMPLEGEALPDQIVLMTRQHARKIWDFVVQHQDRVGAVVVHCEQGISRSPAIAAAIAEYLGCDSERFFREYLPNAYVYDLMRATTPGRGKDAGGDGKRQVKP